MKWFCCVFGVPKRKNIINKRGNNMRDYYLAITIAAILISFFSSYKCIKLRKEINTDNLTGLGSRRKLMVDLDRLVKKGKPFIVAFIDLDGLKIINDAMGHEAGNQVLRAFAFRLNKKFKASYRIGGDEFIVLVEGNTDLETIMQEICIIKQDKSSGFYKEHIHFSVGMAKYPDHATSKEALMELSDAAMYEDKNGKKSRC